LQVLFAIDLSRAKEPPAPEEVFDAFVENFELAEGACAFARELVDGISAAKGELDALLEKHTTNWRLSRMAAVDRNILRIGTFELLRSETPTEVILDEAIELARRFGSDPSPAFVNGVLDAVAGDLRVGARVSGSTAEPVS
jgi:N utilization substance protein B